VRRKLTVAPRGARRNGAQRFPDLLLKRSSIAVHDLVVERQQIAIENNGAIEI
jgi:hypothetical protein